MVRSVVFFNPYADGAVKGAARRIEFLAGLLRSRGVPVRIVLAADHLIASKSWPERLAQSCGLARLAYFLHACQLTADPAAVVISEVIFTPTWRRNLVLTVHDLKAFDAKATRGGRLRKWAYLVFARLASRVVVVSNAVRDDMVRLCGVAAERIQVIPNGISNHRLALARDCRQPVKRYDFIYVSSFAPHKRHAMLLRAAPSGARVCLIGRDLGALDGVREVVRQRGSDLSVEILESVDTDEDLFAYLGAAHCGIFPSVFEGFGIPLLEYVAAGLVVIATDIPPFLELKDCVDTFVPADDEPALARAMAACLSDRPTVDPHAFERLMRGPYTEAGIANTLCASLQVKVS
jgi:glycosyltransferase involved in cell wall biosynthesis